MRISNQSIRAAWLTARRAGLKRTLFRLQRRLRLKVINPLLAQQLYNKVSQVAEPPDAFSINSEFHKRLAYMADMYQKGHAHNAWDVAQNKLTLLNQAPVELGLPVSWFRNPINDPLWLFHLHGWEWACPKLTISSNQRAVFSLWEDWLAQVPIGKSIAWEPYPTSRRLVVWVTAWQLLQGNQEFTAAIAQHAHYLTHHLERDLDNNHLVANAKALVWAGLLLKSLPDAASWLETGTHWLWECIRTQVRADGGHVENSTSYHMAVWLDVLSTIYLCQACDVPVPDDIYESVCRMGEFAWSLMLPNGRLPLLNDSIQDEPLPTAQIFDLADKVLAPTAYRMKLDSPRQSKIFADTGMAVFHLNNEQTYLLFDAGEIGPEHCPGHGHADTLSIELWAYGQPLIVDPGTYQYPAGKWRDYFRSTAVHSTATVDNLDQSEFAGPFRIGNMAHGHLNFYDLESINSRVSGAHDGYNRLSDPVIHQREIIIKSAQEIVLVDQFLGKTQHAVALNFHLATENTRVTVESAIEAYYPEDIQIQISVNSPISGSFKKESGWLSSVWYKKVSTSIVKFQAEVNLPATFETTIKISEKESL